MLIAHVSDLHIGRNAANDRAVTQLAWALDGSGAAAVLVSGDVTHGGLLCELTRFEALFRPLLDSGRMVVVPGNHDRLGDDAGRALMSRGRVATWGLPGLHVVRVDSTGAHNSWAVRSHGVLTPDDLAAVDAALDRAPAGAAVVALLHHHPLPLPADRWAERLASLVGLPYAAELAAGERLLERLRGRCDVVLHGHRHCPSEAVLDGTGARPLRVINAGCSADLMAFRTLRIGHQGATWVERWIDVQPGRLTARAARAWRPVGGRAAA